MKIEIPLTKKQTELDKSLDSFDVTGYGGAKGGGKSHGARSVILLRTLTRPGHVGAIFRRTYPELEENHIAPLFKQFPKLRDYYNSSRREIRFPELQSEFKFRFCESQSDVDGYAGREYHTLGIEEAGDWPTEMAFRLMRNCNRSTVKGIKAATFLAFNWGGIGHGGLKRIFITKDLRDTEKKLTYNFILAKVEDNPAILENDPGYLDRLESEPNEALRRAYRYGDPDIVAGQYFDLRRDVHVIKPFKIPPYWSWFGAYDYGYNHPAVFLFFAVDTDGVVYLVDEICGAKRGLVEQAKLVGDYRRGKNQSDEMEDTNLVFQAGHDCWAKKKGTDPTIAEDFDDETVVGKGNTIILARAKIDRIQGAHRVRQYLSYQMKDGKRYGPNFYIFNRCVNTIECLTRMVHDENKAEDVLKVDSIDGSLDSGDDCYDAVRMGLMSRPIITPSNLMPISRNSKEWFEKQENEMEEAALQMLEQKEQDPWTKPIGEWE